MVFVTRELGASNYMAPLRSNFVASFHIDHRCRHWGVEATVTSKVTVIDILNRVVRVGRADAN